MENQARLISVTDFCNQFKISRTQFYREVNSGKIPLLKMGRMSRVRMVDAEQWLNSLSMKEV